MDNRVDRKNFIVQQSKLLGINLNRISAITPNKINLGEVKEEYNVMIGPGELCCSLSHRFIWQKIVNSKESYALILEDDIVISKHLKDVLSKITLSKFAFKLLRIETRNESVRFGDVRYSLDERFKIRRTYNNAVGTAGYIISRDFCKTLLNDKNLFTKPLDHILFYKNNLGDIQGQFLQIFPALVTPLEEFYAGDIGNFIAKRIISSSIGSLRFKDPIKRNEIKIYNKIAREVFKILLQFISFPKALYNSITGKKSFFKHRIFFAE
ncbi:glycosyltransferase family 25 protein [Candidatus Methylopumilus planktonicus]|uniref:glycosyltransferase family 25 protein n=1 Tax=Candidatus Methylopumilus planktonicus TaxID=1581557 RepID=UPI003BEF2CCA